MWCTSVDGAQLLYVNPAAGRIYGRPLEEMIRKQDLWLQSIHPQDRPIVEKNLKELLDRRQVQQEYRIIRPDGEVRGPGDGSGRRTADLSLDRDGRQRQSE